MKTVENDWIRREKSYPIIFFSLKYKCLNIFLFFWVIMKFVNAINCFHVWFILHNQSGLPL